MTSKRVLKYGVCPKGAPSGSDGAWRVPLEAIWGSFLMILGCIFIPFSCSFLVGFFWGGKLSYIAGALCGTALHAREHASAATWCPGLFWRRTAQESRKTLVDNDGDAQRLKNVTSY